MPEKICELSKSEKHNANEPPEKILVRFIHFPVETLGPGKRVGVWTQGCSIGCEGCISPENQPFDEACSMPIDEAAEQILSYNCDRVTISGGEPFDQAGELLLLLQKIEQIPDILVYTGYAKNKIMKDHKGVAITKKIAALIDGEFKLGLPAEAVWKGSENQTLTVFRREFAARYESWATERKGKLQLIRKDGETRLIGIPRQEDVPELLEKIRRP